jgi:hypothetical protein
MQPRHVISPSFGASTAVVPSHGKTAWTKARRFRPQRARASLYGMPARKQACGSRASVSAPLPVLPCARLWPRLRRHATDCRTCALGRCRHARRAAAAHPARRRQSDLLLPAARGPPAETKLAFPANLSRGNPPDFAPRRSVRPPPLPPAARAGPVDVHSHGVRRASYAAEHALVMRFGCPGWRARDRGVLGIVLPNWRVCTPLGGGGGRRGCAAPPGQRKVPQSLPDCCARQGRAGSG